MTSLDRKPQCDTIEPLATHHRVALQAIRRMLLQVLRLIDELLRR